VVSPDCVCERGVRRALKRSVGGILTSQHLFSLD